MNHLQTEWQPIETAPKDDSVLLWDNGVLIGFLNGMNQWQPEGYAIDYANPTHWMPLPAPPTD